MNVLHVLSQHHLTGAEVFAVSLAEEQMKQGHSVTIVSDRLHRQTRATYIAQPIHNRRWISRFRNIAMLRRLMRSGKIDCVHAHSRAASWVVAFARIGLNVPMISHVHGRQHHKTSGLHWDVYGDRVLPVCENIARHLIKDLKIAPERIDIVRNAVAPPVSVNFHQPLAFELVWLGRMTGPKGVLFEGLCEKAFTPLLNRFPELRVRSVLAEAVSELPENKRRLFESMRLAFQGRFLVSESAKQVTDELIGNAAFVIGSGRVAIEGLLRSRRVYAVGEASRVGWISRANWDEALRSNFGDIAEEALTGLADPKHFDYAKILSELEAEMLRLKGQPLEFVRDENASELRLRSIHEFSAEKIANRCLSWARALQVEKAVGGSIPILMYHKVPDQALDSKHRIFVAKDRFNEQMRFLRVLGRRTVSLDVLCDVLDGKKTVSSLPRKPVILTFDDGYRDNLSNALPILKRYGFSATLFLLGNRDQLSNDWDKATDAPEPLMTLPEKKQWLSEKQEVGSHAMNHLDLTGVSLDAAEKEMKDSKVALESDLGGPIRAFAYPYGKHTQGLSRLAEKAGYAIAVATDEGGVSLVRDRYRLFRVSIFPEDGFMQIYKKSSPWYARYFLKKRNRPVTGELQALGPDR